MQHLDTAVSKLLNLFNRKIEKLKNISYTCICSEKIIKAMKHMLKTNQNKIQYFTKTKAAQTALKASKHCPLHSTTFHFINLC